MKAITKREFTRECFRAIESMTDEELENVRKGFYTLYNKLKTRGNTLDIMRLNSSSAFLLDITCMTATETMTRIKKEEMQY